uniref:Uncharacterized protein n=1 Tax=Strigamia maritima TaxID=126957 RepID=T1JEX7_STRMM
MLLPIIIDDNRGFLASKTEFFKHLFNYILKHHTRNRDFDLFRLNSSTNAIQDYMNEFGKISVQKILQKDSKFESNDSTNKISEFGLLIYRKEMNFFKTNNFYEVLHLCFPEFAAAFSVWMDFKFNESEFTFSSGQIINHFLETQGKSLTLPFLANLMQDDIDCLLSQIRPCDAQFALRFDLIIRLLSECPSRYTFFGNSLGLWRMSRPALHYYFLSWSFFIFMLNNYQFKKKLYLK